MIEIILLILPFILSMACWNGSWIFDDVFTSPTYEPAHYLSENHAQFQSRFLGLWLFRWTYRLSTPRKIREKLRFLMDVNRKSPFEEPPHPPYWTRMWPHHLVNILIHGMSSVVLYWILLEIFTPNRAAIAALLFSVHPVQMGSLCYLSGRSGMIAFLFAGSSVLIALQGRWELWPLAVVSGMLARYGKEDGVLVLGWFALLLWIYGTL